MPAATPSHVHTFRILLYIYYIYIHELDHGFWHESTCFNHSMPPKSPELGRITQAFGVALPISLRPSKPFKVLKGAVHIAGTCLKVPLAHLGSQYLPARVRCHPTLPQLHQTESILSHLFECRGGWIIVLYPFIVFGCTVLEACAREGSGRNRFCAAWE